MDFLDIENERERIKKMEPLSYRTPEDDESFTPTQPVDSGEATVMWCGKTRKAGCCTYHDSLVELMEDEPDAALTRMYFSEPHSPDSSDATPADGLIEQKRKAFIAQGGKVPTGMSELETEAFFFYDPEPKWRDESYAHNFAERAAAFASQAIAADRIKRAVDIPNRREADAHYNKRRREAVGWFCSRIKTRGSDTNELIEQFWVMAWNAVLERIESKYATKTAEAPDDQIAEAGEFLDRDDSWHVALIDQTNPFDAIAKTMANFGAKVRAEAIDEFVERVNDKFDQYRRVDNPQLILRSVAEELKRK